MMGRNVATYKFALAASLIELSSTGSDFISLEDLAAPFSKNLCEHLKHSDKQIPSTRSQFLDSCKKANQGEVSSEELIETTARLGFVNVIDAFHVVSQGVHRYGSSTTIGNPGVESPLRTTSSTLLREGNSAISPKRWRPDGTS